MQNKKYIISIVVVGVMGAVGVAIWILNYELVGPVATPSKTPYVNIFAEPPPQRSLEELFKIEPDSKATPDKFADYYFIVSRQAVLASSVSIVNCKSEPPVIRMKSGDVLIINNNDSINHKMLSSEWNIVVPAKAKVEIKIEGGGVKKFFCDDKPAGMIFVTR